jgi:hypothetical protein
MSIDDVEELINSVLRCCIDECGITIVCDKEHLYIIGVDDSE